MKKILYPYLVFALIIALFYGNTLFNGFVYDDQTFIVNNPIIKDISNLAKVFTICLTSDSSIDCKGAGVYYHPFLFLQLLLTYQISHSPWFFHLVNLILFFIDSALVYKLIKTVLRQKTWAFLATLFFLTHPINSEIGNFISTINDHYLLIFFVLTFLSFNKFLMLRNRHSGDPPAGGDSRISIIKRDAGQASMTAIRKVSKFIKTNEHFYLILTLVFYFLDLLAKEAAVFLFIPILIYHFFAFAKISKQIHLAKLSLAFLLPFIIYCFLRLIIFGQLVPQIPGYHNMNLLTQFLTGISIYPLYLLKLIYPTSLNAQHDPALIKSIDWRFYGSLIFWIVNIYLVYKLFKKGFKLSLFGFSLIFFSILPILLLINKIGRFILAERYLFLATVGFSLIVFEGVRIWIERVSYRHSGNPSSDGASRISKKTDSGVVSANWRILPRMTTLERAFLLLFVLYLVTSWYIVFNRNKDWHDEFSFNQSIAKLTKSNFGVYYNLANNYFDIKEYDKAVIAYQNAIAVNPKFWEAYFNLANTYLELSNPNYAEKEYKKVLSLNPSFAPAQNALQNLEIIKSGTEAAKMKLKKGLIEFKDQYLKFNFPVQSSFLKDGKRFILSSKDFTVKIELANQDLGEPNSEKPINQGLANLGNFDKSFVKIYKSSMQFFLYKGKSTVNVIVNFTDPSFKGMFDKILGSIELLR